MRDKREEILDDLRRLHTPAMRETYQTMVETSEVATLDNEEFLLRLLDSEVISRKNNTIKRRKKEASLAQPKASIVDIDYEPQRKLDETLLSQLATNDHLRIPRNLNILGATGTGKSYIACALGNRACEEGYRVMYKRSQEIFDDYRYFDRTDQVAGFYNLYGSKDLIIIDDFLLAAIDSPAKENIIFTITEINERRHSIITCSQFEIAEWYDRLGGDQMAEAIIERLTKGHLQLILQGESRRS